MRNIYNDLKQYINFSGTATAREFLDFLIFFFVLGCCWCFYPGLPAKPTHPEFFIVLSYIWLALLIFNIPPLLAVTIRRAKTIGLKLAEKIFCIGGITIGIFFSTLTPLNYVLTQRYSDFTSGGLILLSAIQVLLYSLTYAIMRFRDNSKHNKKLSVYLIAMCLTSVLIVASMLFLPYAPMFWLLVLGAPVLALFLAYWRNMLLLEHIKTILLSIIILASSCTLTMFIWLFIVVASRSTSGHIC